jgi:hypothetical protein
VRPVGDRGTGVGRSGPADDAQETPWDVDKLARAVLAHCSDKRS